MVFVAVTVNVYLTPLVRPGTLAVVAFGPTLIVIPPGFATTLYPVIGDPPSDGGNDQFTVALLLPTTLKTLTGFSGADGNDGIIIFDAVDANDVPTELVAVTVNVYSVPFVNPVTVAVVAFAPADAVTPSGMDVTVYPVIGTPPLNIGTLQFTIAVVFPFFAVTFDGGSGITDCGPLFKILVMIAGLIANIEAYLLAYSVTNAVSI
jgi:hypothetical protein